MLQRAGIHDGLMFTHDLSKANSRMEFGLCRPHGFYLNINYCVGGKDCVLLGLNIIRTATLDVSRWEACSARSPQHRGDPAKHNYGLQAHDKFGLAEAKRLLHPSTRQHGN